MCGVFARDNPCLLELRELYAGLDPALNTPLLWTQEYASLTDLTKFRGHSAWVWQQGNPSLHERAYLLATYYVLGSNGRVFSGTGSTMAVFGLLP